MRKKKAWKLRLFLQLCVVGIALLAAYMLYLDANIKQRFSGSIWQIPAQVYARPLVLNVESETTRKEVRDELRLLGYRSVSDVRNSGEFIAAGNSIVVFRRAFHFPQGYAPATKLKITWNGKRIVSIVDLLAQTTVETARLEPWLVTRLVSSSREDRMLVDERTVPSMLIAALTLVEDKDFYSHHGVAPLSIIRALAANIAAGRTVQGGSTLTQQLVKNVFLTREKSIVRKIKEALMAVIIDARFDKDTILRAYLNEVYLGQNGNMAIHGFGLASHYFFDRPVNELPIKDLALLVGMVKGPSYYSPLRHPERAITRRNLVLRVLFENNLLSAQDYEFAVQAPLDLNTSGSLASGEHPAFMDKVRRELADILAEPSLRESGVKVYTTLDVNAQRRAEKALVSTVERLQKNKDVSLEAAMMVTDTQKGEIRAIVGGKRTAFRGFNRALDAYRPIGSLAKPVVFLTALEDPIEYNLATPLVDLPLSLPDKGGIQWQPQNYDNKFRDQVPLLDALVQSLNVPTVRLGMELGLENISQTFKQMGAQSAIPHVPSLVLGTMAFNLLETSQIYQSLANGGLLEELHTVSAVMSANDNLIWQRASTQQQVIAEDASYLVNYALHQVTQQGTAKRVGQTFTTTYMAGKTGTTNDYRDSWFAGFDRANLTTVWVGNDDNQPIGLSGTSGALPVFIAYQQSQEPKSLSQRFPSGLNIAHFDRLTGLPTTPGCVDTLSVPAVVDALPAQLQTCEGRPIARKKREKEKSWWEKLFGL